MIIRNLHQLLIIPSLSIIWVGCSKQVILPKEYLATKPENIILVIGDGMGLSHITAHLYQQGSTVLEEIVDVGLVTTHSADNLVTDSGAGATAMATGQKANNNAVGVDANGQPVESIMERAKKFGLFTGIVTTSSILDATPAAFYGHRANRYWQDSVSKDLVNCNVDFLLGGGKQFFDGTMEGSPFNISDFEDRDFYITDIWRTPIERLSLPANKRVLYFNGTESAVLHGLGFDHLKNSSKKAIQYLSQKPGQFFLMIEGAQIDWASHAGRQKEVLLRMNAFEMMLKEVLNFARKDGNTLVIITADHTTGGLTIIDGSKPGNVKLNFSTNGHTGSMVPVFAYGPGAELFRGIIDNTEIYEKMVLLLGIGGQVQNPISAK